MRVALVVVLVAGCSFATVRGPADRAERSADDPGCEENTRAPTVDAVITGALFLTTLLGLAALTQSDVAFESETQQKVTAAVVGGSGVLGVVFGYSLRHGLKTAKACSKWKERATP